MAWVDPFASALHLETVGQIVRMRTPQGETPDLCYCCGLSDWRSYREIADHLGLYPATVGGGDAPPNANMQDLTLCTRYIAPADKLAGRAPGILVEREGKLEAARKLRAERRQAQQQAVAR